MIRLCQSVLFGLLLVHACHGKRGGGDGRGGSSSSSRGTGAHSQSVSRVPVISLSRIFGGDPACTSDQLESIHNCSAFMEEELAMISPEAKEIGNLTRLLSENNKANFFTRGFGASFSIDSSLEHGPLQLNVSEIAEIFRNHRNETREIVQAVCRGMNKFVNCSGRSFKESDCNPRSYRMAKAMSEAICDENFQELMIYNQDCVIVAIEDAEVTHCLDRGKNSSQKIIMKVMQDRNKTSKDAMCIIIASVLECFRAALQECGNQVYEQYARMAVTGFSPLFNVECDVDAVVSGELAYIITDDGDVHMKNSPESAGREGDDRKWK